MFEGIYPPLPTPFTDEKINFEMLERNIIKLNKTGLRGYVALGSNGESAFLTREEKLEIIKEVKNAADPNKTIIAGTGSDSVKETMYLNEEAAKAGADAVLVLTPSYYKNQMNNRALIKYFNQIADSSPIPVFIYNVPKFTGIDIAPAAVAELASHGNITGIKDSTENIVHIIEIISLSPKDFILFTGTGSMLYSSLTAGAKGGIAALANVAPNECVNLYSSILNGNLNEALRMQKLLLECNKAVTSGFGVAGLKQAMDFAGYEGGCVRMPLNELNSEEIKEIKRIIDRLPGGNV